MIKEDKWYEYEEDYDELTDEELRAFKLFLTMEAKRHYGDIEHIFHSIGIIDCVLRKRAKNESDRED